MKHNLAFKLSMVVAAMSALSVNSYAAEEDSNEEEASNNVEHITVTGSRIKRSQTETVNPVTVISAEDILKQGHANVYDALDALSMNTTSFVGEENTNNFNANAMGINLRGFGEGYTLVLINGNRVPILPKPQGAVAGNFVNLAMIPTAAVQRIEVLTGGASAIYGSDAVAGVVNIILKKDAEFNEVSYRYGETTNGGGESQRFSFVSGNSWDDTNLTYGLQIDSREPIYGSDREWFDEPSDSPDADQRVLGQVMSFWNRFEPNAWMLNDLSSECAAQGYQPDRSSFYDTNTDWWGENDPYYCGDNLNGEYSIRNGRDRYSAFLNLQHEINDSTSFNLDILGFYGKADAGLYRYGFGVDYDVLDNNGNWLGSRHIYRRFTRDEIPTSDQKFNEDTLIANAGISGYINDFHEYNVTLSLGQYNYEDRVTRFNDQDVLAAIFGGEKGTNWDQPWLEEYGDRWVTVNASSLNDRYLPTGIDFFGDVNAADYQSALQDSVGDGKSHLYSLSADFNGDLFDMGSGAAQYAVVTEIAEEGYKYVTDDATINGDIYGWSGIRGEGERNRYSLGSELLFPLLGSDSSVGSLDFTIAGRYDYYDDDSNVDGATTYQAGLAWRPMDSLLIRASHATSFRAPDLHYLFGERSSSFATGIDYLSCIESGTATNWNDCGDTHSVNPRQYAEGDISLEEETGHSTSLGFAADFTDELSMTVDLYEIQLENKVGIISAGTVLRYEAECALGVDQFGNSVDSSSPKCAEMLSRVTRAQDGRVLNVSASPFNTGLRKQQGVDASLRYDTSTDYGMFGAQLNYTHIFETEEAYLPEDEIEDVRDAQWSSDIRTRINASVYWSNDDAWVSFYGNMLGSAPISSAPEGRFGSWVTWNLSTGYHFNNNFNLGLSVVNLFDRRPPQAETDSYWPYFDVYKYHGTGQEIFLTAKYQF